MTPTRFFSLLVLPFFILVASACELPGDVVIATTDNAQAVVDANPAGTRYRFAAGVHTNVHVVPKDGDSFLGADAGAIIDGGGASDPAFRSFEVVKDVSIFNLAITNYNPTPYEAVIDAGSQEWGDTGTWRAPTNWAIYSVDLYDNTGAYQSAAIKVGGGSTITDNRIFDNNGAGIWGHGENMYIADNEIFGNSRAATDSEAGNHSGGIKLVAVHDSIVTNNNVHDNQGPGIWCDANCDNVEIHNNFVTDNEWAGVQYEVSFRGNIHDNIVTNNGQGDFRNWLWDGGIVVSNSVDVVVSDNILDGNDDGITVIDQRTARNDGRFSIAPGEPRRIGSGQAFEIPSWAQVFDADGELEYWRSEDVRVLNNTINNSGASGASNGGGDEAVGSDLYATTVFSGNTYTNFFGFYWATGSDVAPNAGDPEYQGNLTLAQWQAFGND